MKNLFRSRPQWGSLRNICRELRKYASLEYLTRNNINAILDKLLPDKSKYKKHRKSILEATAIAAYQKAPLRHLSSLLLMMRHSSS